MNRVPNLYPLLLIDAKFFENKDHVIFIFREKGREGERKGEKQFV